MTQRSTFQRFGVVALLASAVLLVAPRAEAQRWGRPRTPQAGACFYQNANFRGDYFCVAEGEALEQMPSGLNDKISSIRTFGDVEVTVFRNPGFGGRSTRFTDDVSNLQLEGWNDTLSSLQVRRSGFRGNGGFGGGGYRQPGNVDRIIERAYEDLLEREPDPAGFREYRRRMLDDGWSDADVREAIRRSPEYREHMAGVRSGRDDRWRDDRGRDDRGGAERRDERGGMTRERAEEIVRRAYQSTLGRDPDPGAAAYVTRVLRDNWTAQDVIRELRKSPEYRNRRPGGR
jgi:hypothetical protein